MNDPAAGSWYVESYTQQMAAFAWDRFRFISAAGGMAACLTDGLLAAEIEAAWQRRLERLADGVERVVGVTHYRQASEPEPPDRGAPRGGRAAARLGSARGGRARAAASRSSREHSSAAASPSPGLPRPRRRHLQGMSVLPDFSAITWEQAVAAAVPTSRLEAHSPSQEESPVTPPIGNVPVIPSIGNVPVTQSIGNVPVIQSIGNVPVASNPRGNTAQVGLHTR